MNIIARNALSPWSSGYKHKGMTFRPATLHGGMPMIHMGQAGAPALTLAVRDQTLATLNDAWQRAEAVDTWRAANPDWEVAMGADGQLVKQLQTTAAPLLAAATKVRTALQSADPAAWVLTQQEVNDANAWATAVRGMYDAVAKHSTTLRPITTPTTPGTATTAVPKTDYMPYYIAGGAAALIAIALLLKKKSS